MATVIHQAKPCIKCGSIEERDKRGECKACRKARAKAWHEAHREEKKAYDKAHREEQKAYDKAYRKTHREERVVYRKARRASDPLFRLKYYIRSKTTKALRAGGYSKKSSTAVILGCTFEELKAHLEKQFWPGMTWENRGEWHIDHIIPLASVQTEGETLSLCHFSNLQPLWADDNLSKHNRLDWTPAESLHDKESFT